MDVVFTVAVNDRAAHLTLSEAHGGERFDDSFIDLAAVADPINELVSTIASTDRGLAEGGHRLVGTRVSWSDVGGGNALCGALVSAGIQGVTYDSGSHRDESPLANCDWPGAGGPRLFVRRRTADCHGCANRFAAGVFAGTG